MNINLVIIGASGHGKVIADIATKVGYEGIAFLDDNSAIQECGAYNVLGTSRDYVNFVETHDFVVAVGNSGIRERIQEQLENVGCNMVTIVHPSAVIGDDVKIGAGTVVMANAVINPCTNIGKGCIINTGCTVDHDNQIADYVHISVGAHLAGTVSIGEKTWIGAGAVVSNNVKITGNCMIGAGAVVVKDILEAGTYVGVPAQLI